MQANPHLSIVIPTYNRADILDYCLEVHIPLARAHNVQLFISDNASTDATAEVVRKRIKEYPLIKYYRNETNVGPDANFELALKYPQTEYVWLLGDTYQIPPEGISYLLNLILKEKPKYDMFLFNVGDELKGVSEQDYTDQNALLLDMCWLMTCMSCLVYSSKLISNANYEHYRNTYFIQTGIIFEYITNKDFTIHWEPNLSVKRWENYKGLKKESWQSQMFEIWFKNRANFIFSLPASYDLNVKLKCIMSNGPYSSMSIKTLLLLRSDGVLNYRVYRHYSYLFPLTIKLPKFVILIIALVPQGVLRVLKVIYRFGSSRKCVLCSR